MVDYELLKTLYENAGLFGLAAGAAMIGIRWVRKPGVQENLPPMLNWSMWPRWVRLAAVLASALLSTFVASLAAGVAPIAGLVAAVPASIAAILGHKATKAVGHALHESAEAKAVRYRAGSIRTSLDSLGLLPLNHKKYRSVLR